MDEIIEDLKELKNILVRENLIDADNRPSCLCVYDNYYMCKEFFPATKIKDGLEKEELLELEREGFVHNVSSYHWWEACEYCDTFIYKLCMIFKKYNIRE